MPRSRILLLAMLLLARPQPVLAKTPTLVVPGVVEGGQRVEVRWDRLPGSAQEVELELSLDGGRWVRISPELEAREGFYVWSVPAVTSAHARLRLRAGGSDAGGEFEDVAATSVEFSIGSRASGTIRQERALEWWHVGERVVAPGWGRGESEPNWCRECAGHMAAPDSRSQTCAPATASVCSRIDRRIESSLPCPANAGRTTPRGRPLRL
jgi:hypothetical protein